MTFAEQIAELTDRTNALLDAIQGQKQRLDAAVATVEGTAVDIVAARDAVNAATAQAGVSTGKAGEAASSATAASTAAATLTAALASFRKIWCGDLAADPTVDGNGDALIEGAGYFNTVADRVRIYHSGAWHDADETTQAATTNAVAAATQAATSAAAALADRQTVTTLAAQVQANAAQVATNLATSGDAATITANKDAAAASAGVAAASETNAKSSESAAKNSETATKASETAAAASASTAAAAANTASEKLDSTAAQAVLASAAANTATEKSDASVESAAAAKDSENAAKLSETNAKASENAAGLAKTAAQQAAASIDTSNFATKEALAGKSDTSHTHADLYEQKNANIQAHIASTENPHGVTAEQIGAATAAQGAKADTALQQTGGVITGKITGTHASMAGYIDKTYANAAATGAVALDCAAADTFVLTLTGAVTLSVTNLPTLAAGEEFAIIVRVKQGATSYTIAWFTIGEWLTTGGAAPAAPAAGKTQEYVLTYNGTAWTGRKGAGNA